jgi:sterol desaturase/sphingolipid hydroxylase (fatty acid hydroxylase superfamily)
VSNVSLRGEAKVMFSFPGPRLIAAALVVAVVARVSLGQWGWADLVVAAAILAFEPFTEWLIHVFVLHFKPRTIGGRRVDPLASRKHREHHADPKDRELVLVPAQVIFIGVPVAAAIALLVADPMRLGVTGLVTGYAMLLAYEWTHHLIHSAYRPNGRYYRTIWRAHRLHHFRNENYWFGVTMTLGDHVLRTSPQKDEVPLSPTARALHADV